MKYKVYRQIGAGAEKQYTLLNKQVMLTDGSTTRRELQGEDYIQIKQNATLESPLALREGDFIVDARFGRYILADDPLPTTNDGVQEYALKFEAEHRLFRKYIFRLILNARSETVWSLTDTLSRHLDCFCTCLRANDLVCYDAETNKILDFTYQVHYEERDKDTGRVLRGVVPREYRAISYDNIDMLSALDTMAEVFECEWWRESNVLHFGFLGEDEERAADARPTRWKEVSLYRERNGVLLPGTASSITPQQSSGEKATRLYVAGGERNIPSKYRRALVLTPDYIEGVAGETEWDNGGFSAFKFRDPLRPIKRSFLRGVQETVQYHDTIQSSGFLFLDSSVPALSGVASEGTDLTPYRGITANVVWNDENDPACGAGYIDLAIDRMKGWCVVPQLYFIDAETNLVLGFINIILCGRETDAFNARKEIRAYFPPIQTLGRPVRCEFRYSYFKIVSTSSAGAGGGVSGSGFAQSATVQVGESTATFYTSIAWFNSGTTGMTSSSEIIRTDKLLATLRKWMASYTAELINNTLHFLQTGNNLFPTGSLAPLAANTPSAGSIDTSLGGGFGGAWDWGIGPDNNINTETGEPTTPTPSDAEIVPPFVQAQMVSETPRIEIVRNQLQMVDLTDGATITVSYNDALRLPDNENTNASEEEQTLIDAQRDEELNGIKFQMSDRDAWQHLSRTRRLMISETDLDPSTPSAYYSDLYEAGVAYKLGERRLLLPEENGETERSGVRLHYTDKYVELASNSEHPLKIKETVKTYDDEFPRYVLTVGEVASCRRLAQREVMDDNENNGITRDTFFRQYYILDEGHSDSTWFKREWLLNGQTLRIHFNTGLLAGMEFDCQLDVDIEGDNALLEYEPYKQKLNTLQQLDTLIKHAPDTLSDEDRAKLQAQADEVTRQLQRLVDISASDLLRADEMQPHDISAEARSRPRFKIIRNDEYGATFPNEECYPAAGDQFILIGWNIAYAESLGLSQEAPSTQAAEKHLRERALYDLVRLAQNDRTYQCTMRSEQEIGTLFTDENGNYLPAPVPKILRLGTAVKVQDPDTGELRRSRVIAYECPLDIPWDAPTITCGIAASYSRLADIEGKLRKTTKP